MNMAMWIGLSKVSGKYMLSQLFNGRALEVVCSLFDYISACLEPVQTSHSIRKLKKDARKLAKGVGKWFPETEKSMVLHMLVFHVPDYLGMWGPARGWWVFAFERYVPRDEHDNLSS